MKKKRYRVTQGEIKERVSEQEYIDGKFFLAQQYNDTLSKRLEILEEQIKVFKALNKGNYKIVKTYSMFRANDPEELKKDGFEFVEGLKDDRELWIKKEEKK